MGFGRLPDDFERWATGVREIVLKSGKVRRWSLNWLLSLCVPRAAEGLIGGQSMKHAALGSDVGEKPYRSVSSYTLLNRLAFGILYRIRNERHLRVMKEPAAFLGAFIPIQAGSAK
jgi:hypothetical protein